jgi:hypothetical protein
LILILHISLNMATPGNISLHADRVEMQNLIGTRLRQVNRDIDHVTRDLREVKCRWGNC